MPASPPPSRPAPDGRDPVRVVLSWVWAFTPAWSLGFLSAPLMIFAITRIRHWLHILMSVVYVACVVLMFANAGHADGTPEDTTFGWALAVNMIVATGHALVIRKPFFDSRPEGGPSGIRQRQQAAIALSMEYEEARESARELAESDPARAIELRIGRIDIPDRLFPDGGLIDVNNVPVDVLIGQLPELAPYRNALATGQRFGFSSVEEMSVTAGLPPRILDHAAERLIFLQRYNRQPSVDA